MDELFQGTFNFRNTRAIALCLQCANLFFYFLKTHTFCYLKWMWQKHILINWKGANNPSQKFFDSIFLNIFSFIGNISKKNGSSETGPETWILIYHWWLINLKSLKVTFLLTLIGWDLGGQSRDQPWANGSTDWRAGLATIARPNVLL